MLYNINTTFDGLMLQKFLGLMPYWPLPKLLPAPSRAAMARGAILINLEKKFPDYQFTANKPFYNPMICPDCCITAEHFFCWKDGAPWKDGDRYQIWACGRCEWVFGPWSCCFDPHALQ